MMREYALVFARLCFECPISLDLYCRQSLRKWVPKKLLGDLILSAGVIKLVVLL